MAEIKQQQELNLDTKVNVKSIAGWAVTFPRYETQGDVNIAPGGSVRLSRSEIIAQINNNNGLFVGRTDGMGSHATLYIDDKPTRIEVNFEDDKRAQNVFSADVVKKVFAAKTQAEFEKQFKSAFITRAEKYAVMQEVKRQNINDFNKIRFAEQYTGYKLQ